MMHIEELYGAFLIMIIGFAIAVASIFAPKPFDSIGISAGIFFMISPLLAITQK